MDDERTLEAERALAESKAAKAADQPLIALADQVIGELRSDRWADAVRVALQARRGAA